MKRKILIIMFAVLASLVACKLTSDGISIISGDFECPKLLSLVPIDEEKIEISFSKSIKAQEIDFYQLEKNTTSISENPFGNGLTLKGTGKSIPVDVKGTKVNTLQVSLANGQKTKSGEKYGLDGKVCDENGNSLSFIAVLTAFNPKVPDVILNEIRTSRSGAKTKFIELKALSDGNLSGVNLVSACNSNDAMRYEFFDIDVQKGDFIVLHILPNDNEIPISETKENGKKSSDYSFASDKAWDFFVSEASFNISSTGVVLLEKQACGDIAGAFLMCKSGKDDWAKSIQKDLALKAFNAKKWTEGSNPSTAFESDNLSGGASVARIDAGHEKSSWQRYTASKATPGN